MLIEEKARAYDRVSKEVKDFFEGKQKMYSDVSQTLEYLFPELKEPEDEKIRKDVYNYLYNERHNIRQLTPYTDELDRWLAWLEKQKPINISIEDKRIRKSLINYVKAHGNGGDFTKEKYIAWLEKQGEPKNKINSCKFTCEDILALECSMKTAKITKGGDELYKILVPLYNKIHNAYLDELQGEQKPVDKVEPKFKMEKGKWYVCDTSRYTDFIVGKAYYCPKNGMLKPNENAIARYVAKDCFHLWTIQDAKDGDVLAYVTDEEDLWIMIYWSLYEPYEGHVHYHVLLVNDNFSDKGTCCICINDLKPATKEQCDLLFKKMNEAGYEWDAEKKKLSKRVIDEGKAEMDYCFTKMMNGEKVSPIWSEEDEEMLEDVRFNFVHNKEKMTDSLITQYNRFFDKIKSLKPQPKQEWSEEDEEAIEMAIIAMEDMYDEDEPNTTYGGYNLPFNKAAERLKSLKQRIGG